MPSTQASPKLSLCVPCYNSAPTIRETVTSLLSQNFSDLEIVILDNASQDATLEALKDLHDSRMRIESIENTIPAGANIARAIAAAHGTYLGICHADDVYEPDFARRGVEFLDRHPEVSAVFCRATLINPQGAAIGLSHLPRELLDLNSKPTTLDFVSTLKLIMRDHNYLVCPSAIVRTCAYRNLKRGWTFGEFGSSVDLGIWLELLEESKIGIISTPLIRYRRSDSQHSAVIRRTTTSRADFFKVLDYYISRREVSALLNEQDRRNLWLLEYKDRCLRAVNLLLADNEADASALLCGTWFNALTYSCQATTRSGPSRFFKWCLAGFLIQTLAAIPFRFGRRTLLLRLFPR